MFGAIGNWFRNVFSSAQPASPQTNQGAAEIAPKQIDHRNEGQQVALILVHGFTGDTGTTWAGFVDLLLAEARIRSWDLIGLGYPTNLRLDIPLWEADPDIGKLALGLKTTLSVPPFSEYQKIALAAHSMGGLVVQRAILMDPKLKERISHLFLFGTPSAGLIAAGYFSSLKRQLRDMNSKGTFIHSLRQDWTARIPAPPPFFFRTVAGNLDEFVPAWSSIEPFRDEYRAVVPGNHIEIVKPTSARHQSFALVLDGLTGGPQRGRPAFDGARLAVELGKFQEAVTTLLPHAESLDDNALASLSLALEGLKRSDEAVSVLEKHFKGGNGISSTDAQGILAGRLKRRWLVERQKNDLDRARELYFDALQRSEADNDHSQAYYHAINVAFLDLLSSSPNSDVPAAVRSMAERALQHCSQAQETQWRVATEAEAFLMRNDLDGAESLYRRAKVLTASPRELDSMYAQAVRVATHVFREEGALRIERLFGIDAAAPNAQAPRSNG